MRLCILTWEYPVVSETFIREPVGWLRERGHRAAVVTSVPGSLPGGDAGGPPPRLTEVSRRRRLLLVARAPLHAARCLARARRMTGRDGRSAASIAYLATLPEVRGADCLLAHFGPVGAFWLPIAAAARRPLGVFFHGLDATRVPREQPGIYDRLFASGAMILTNSEFLRERLAALGAPPDRLAVVPLAAAPAFHEAARDRAAAEKVIVTVARLVEKKGLDDSIAAFARAQPALRGEWRFEIVGDGPLLADLAAAAKSAGVGGLVDFRGALSREATLAALRRASIFVLASKPTPAGDSDGTPVSILEAAALGLPVVATRTAGIPEILPPGAADGGFLVPPGDVGALADALARLGASEEARRTWGDACRVDARAHRSPADHVAALVAALSRATRPPIFP